MLRNLLLYFYLLGLLQSIFSQDLENKNSSIRLSSGIDSYSSADRLLNYYSYNGILVPVKLTVTHRKNNITYGLNTDLTRGELKLEKADALYYEYNYIKHQQYNLSLFYHRELFNWHEKFIFQAGLSSDLNFIFQQENFKTLLYDYGNGYRSSYSISALTLSPSTTIYYRISHKQILTTGSSISLLSYNSRPTDDYVKQFHIEETGSVWRLYGGKKYIAVNFNACYNYRIVQNLDIVLEYNFNYKKYSISDECKYQQNMFLIGLEMHF